MSPACDWFCSFASHLSNYSYSIGAPTIVITAAIAAIGTAVVAAPENSEFNWTNILTNHAMETYETVLFNLMSQSFFETPRDGLGIFDGVRLFDGSPEEEFNLQLNGCLELD